MSGEPLITLRLSQLVEVFGSNARGVHGAGHAAHCSRFRGAEYGVGFGRTGMSFAIPTKETPYSGPLDLGEIYHHVGQLYGYVEAHPNERFIAGRIGCGLAGIPEQDMINMLAGLGGVPRNLRWPNLWMETLAPDRFYPSLIVAGSRDVVCESDQVNEWIREGLDALREKHPGREPVIVTGLARGPDRWGMDYAKANGVPYIACPAEWDVFGKRDAGHIRNQLMSMVGSGLSAIWDGKSAGTSRMINIAQTDGLSVRIHRPQDQEQSRPMRYGDDSFF